MAASADQGVGIHVNEVPINAPRLFETEYYDIQAIEVLRGPQGTLYGRNATGGTVNMSTARAELDTFLGNVEGQYGDHKKLVGHVNIPVGDNFAMRFAGIYLERDGYTENLYTGNDVDGRDQYSVRGSFKWLPSENTTVDLMLSYFEEDSNRSRSTKTMCKNDPSGVLGCLPDGLDFDLPNPSAQLSNILASDLALGPLGIFPFGSNARPESPNDLRETISDFDPIYYADETLVTLNITHELDNHTLALVALSLVPVVYGLGWIYLAGAALGGAYFVAKSIALIRRPGPKAAMVNFKASLLQLGLLQIAAVADRLLLG